MLLQMALFHSLLYLSNSPLYLCVYTHTHTFTTSSLFIHLSVNGHLDCFDVLAIVNNTAMNIGVYVSFQIRAFIFSGCMPMSGIAGSYGYSVL